MKRFYPLLLAGLIGAVLVTAVNELRENSQETLPPDWRNDYHTLTQEQFLKKHGRTFLNAVQNCCDDNLVCGWDKTGGEL